MQDDYALIIPNSDKDKKYKKDLCEDDKGTTFYCPKCMCEMVVCGITRPLHFRAKTVHNKISNKYNDNAKCPNDSGDGTVIKKYTYGLDKIVSHEDNNPTEKQIENFAKSLLLISNKETEPPGVVDTNEPEDPQLFTFPEDDGDSLVMPFVEDEGDSSNDTPSIECDDSLPALPQLGHFEEKNVTEYNLIKLYNAVESGSSNEIINTTEEPISAHDLVVNYNTLLENKKNGFNGYKLVHAFRICYEKENNTYPLAIHKFIKPYTENGYIILRDDFVKKNDSSHKKDIIYYLIRLENDELNKLVLKATRTKYENKALHYLLLSNQWKLLDNPKGYTVYIATLNSKSFKIIFKPSYNKKSTDKS